MENQPEGAGKAGASSPPGEVRQWIARNVRDWRMRRQLSLTALANAANVAKSTLSELESGRGNPSVDTLWAIAGALNVSFAALFEHGPTPGGVQLVRRAAGPVVVAEGTNFTVQQLLNQTVSGPFEIDLVTLGDGAEQKMRPHSPGVVEHVLGIEGIARVGPEGMTSDIEPGDLLSFPADQPHSYGAVGGPALIAVVQVYMSHTSGSQATAHPATFHP